MWILVWYPTASPLRSRCDCVPVCFWTLPRDRCHNTVDTRSSLFSRQGLSVTIWIPFFLSTSLFIPSSLLIYPSRPPPPADAHPGISESFLNHSLTERGKERGDGGRDKGAWEIERGKREGWGLERTWNEPINPECLLSCVKCLSLADA